ncbi:hypothetical protein GUJ93_ZPchr0009g2295 [Zizania palustris]|uniref:Uncharacterized protein n=1 Tax=Zizania palustris TaxID=103762 RepID=A0A8J5V8C9_ZIZPA|nr:hypothetical protein GUJ93_ZPchr0009g2295 [Zizania palustris]
MDRLLSQDTRANDEQRSSGSSIAPASKRQLRALCMERLAIVVAYMAHHLTSHIVIHLGEAVDECSSELHLNDWIYVSVLEQRDHRDLAQESELKLACSLHLGSACVES